MAKNILKVGGYELIRRIGTGARSTIYEATNDDKKKVALKRVIIEKPEDLRILEQVETEFKVARKIDNPYIRKCLKFSKIRKILKVREVLLAMELFDGLSLEDGPTLSLVDVLLVFRMVANGLSAMHREGFLHCDIKPNNILINSSGAIKIIDLGQSCRHGTVKPRIQGTPDYIAPEQVLRKPLTARTDIFNLGATMYWALTGTNVPTLIPRKGEEIDPDMPRHFPPPHRLRSKVPLDVSKLVMDCVKDKPAERPPHMPAVASRLDAVIHNLIGGKIKTARNASRSN